VFLSAKRKPLWLHIFDVLAKRLHIYCTSYAYVHNFQFKDMGVQVQGLHIIDVFPKGDVQPLCVRRFQLFPLKLTPPLVNNSLGIHDTKRNRIENSTLYTLAQRSVCTSKMCNRLSVAHLRCATRRGSTSKMCYPFGEPQSGCTSKMCNQRGFHFVETHHRCATASRKGIAAMYPLRVAHHVPFGEHIYDVQPLHLHIFRCAALALAHL
jgi:hypothetical protein